MKARGVLNQYQRFPNHSSKRCCPHWQFESQEYAAIEAQLNQARMALVQIEETGIIDQYAELQEALAQIDAGQKELDQAKGSNRVIGCRGTAGRIKIRLDLLAMKDKNKREAQRDGRLWRKVRPNMKKALIMGRQKRKKAFAKAEEELREAKKEIDDAWKKVDDILNPFMCLRKQNRIYQFENDSAIVEELRGPLIFFFLVAALVCSTTMRHR